MAGVEGTRREEAAGLAGGGTRREDVPPVGGRTLREGVGSGFGRGVLPPGLAARFVVARELDSGAEADVMLAEEVGSGRACVVKLYRPGIVPDEEAVARLARADRAHVVEVIDRGIEEGCWFEVLEFCAGGSLRTLMREGQRLALIDVVREVGEALADLHALGVVHRDLKPENILVRAVSPLDLVLGDFGVVRTVAASVRWTRAAGTPEYSPPEFEGGEVSPAWDWWSLGMIVAELAGERHPFALPDGTLLDDRQIRASLAQRPVDLSAVRDQRAVLLCRGLLSRDRYNRWGSDQVTAWLGGGSPPVSSDPLLTPGSRSRQVLFAGTDYESPAALAGAFQQRWAEAFRTLFQERDSRLVEELERMCRQHDLDEAVRLLAVGSASAAELPRRFAALLAEMDPALDPVYEGVRLSPHGLEATALKVIRAGGDHPAGRVLDEIRRQGILTIWRALPGMTHGPAIQGAWDVADEELVSAVNGLAPHGFIASHNDWALLRAWLLLCALDVDHHGAQLRGLVENLDRVDADQQIWWRGLRDTPNPTPAVLSLTLLAQPTAIQQTHQQQESAQQAQEAAATRQREDQERRVAERQQRSRDTRMGVAQFLAALAFAASPFAIMYWVVLQGNMSKHASGTGSIISLLCFAWLLFGIRAVFLAAGNLFSGSTRSSGERGF